MLKLLQQPGVVTNMTVSVFVLLLLLFFLLFLVPMPHKCAKLSVCRLRNGRERSLKESGVSIAVKEHKTAASQVAEVPLSDEQELVSLYRNFNHNSKLNILWESHTYFFFPFSN